MICILSNCLVVWQEGAEPRPDFLYDRGGRPLLRRLSRGVSRSRPRGQSGRLHGQRPGRRHHVAGLHQRHLGPDAPGRHGAVRAPGPGRGCGRHFRSFSGGPLHGLPRRGHPARHPGGHGLPCHPGGQPPGHPQQEGGALAGRSAKIFFAGFSFCQELAKRRRIFAPAKSKKATRKKIVLCRLRLIFPC